LAVSRNCLGLRHVLLGEEVLLQLHVVDPVDEQPEDDWLTVVELSLADHVSSGEPHVALPGLGLEVGEDSLDWLSQLLTDLVEFCDPRLHGLLCHAAGDDVLENPLLREVLDLGPEAAVEHLGTDRTPPGRWTGH
jgi:hypothetical protein